MSTTAPNQPGTSSQTPSASPPDGPAPTRRTLQRSRQHRVLGGVAGGFSEYFGVDVVIIRIAFVVLASMAGSGVLAYIAAWVLLPKAAVVRSPHAPRATSRFGNLDGHQLLAIALVGIGAMALFDRMGIGINGDVLLPFILIGIGAAVLMSARSSTGSSPTDQVSRVRHTMPEQVPVPASYESPVPTAPAGADVIDEFDLLRAPRAREFEAGHLLLTPTQVPSAPTTKTLPRRQRTTRTPFSRSAFGLFLVSLGVLFVATRIGLFDGRIDRLFASALFIVGVFLVVGARLGRPRGFGVIGVLLTFVLTLFAVTDTTWKGGFGERYETPTSLQDVKSQYNLGGGVMTLNLSKINFAGQRKRIAIDVSAGALAVEVPEGVRVETKGSAGLGELTLFGKSWSGSDVNRKLDIEGNKGTIELDVHVGFGAVEVARVGKLKKLTDLGNGNVKIDVNNDGEKRIAPIDITPPDITPPDITPPDIAPPDIAPPDSIAEVLR